MPSVTAFDIKAALAKKHEFKEFFLTECKTGPTWAATAGGLLQFDAIAIYKSWSTPRFIGYEIKVSRSDFQRDSKFAGYLPYVHEFYFVVPTGLIDRMELPNDIGLMYYNPATKALTTKKRAIYRNIEINPEMLLYIIMNRLDSDRVPFASNKAEYFKLWLDGKMRNRELGFHVQSKLLDEVKRLEREVEQSGAAPEIRAAYDAILSVIRKHGISTWSDAAKHLDEALSCAYPQDLEIVERQLSIALKTIDEIKARRAQTCEAIESAS